MHDAAQAVADALPNAEHRSLKGQMHDLASEVLAPVLVEFLKGCCRPEPDNSSPRDARGNPGGRFHVSATGD